MIDQDVCCYSDDGNIRTVCLGFIKAYSRSGRGPVHNRHLDVKEEEVERLPLIGFKGLEAIVHDDQIVVERQGGGAELRGALPDRII